MQLTNSRAEHVQHTYYMTEWMASKRLREESGINPATETENGECRIFVC